MNVKITRRKFIKSAGVALPIIVGWDTADANSLTNVGANPQRLVLWYEKPATQWVEALPVVNGRLGAMVFGGTANERLQLNEDTLYAGGPYCRVRYGDRVEALHLKPGEAAILNGRLVRQARS